MSNANPSACWILYAFLIPGLSACAPDEPSHAMKSTNEASVAVWTKLKDKPGWSPRDMHGVVVHNNHIWLMGGQNVQGDLLSDIWKSGDGIHWSKVSDATGWTPRKDFSIVSFKNQMWILGEGRRRNSQADVWSSGDGITWNKITENAPWGSRYGFAVAVHQERMFIYGGLQTNGTAVFNKYSNDIWSTPDGISWNKVVDHAAWAPRMGHSTVVFQGGVWLTGGSRSAFSDLLIRSGEASYYNDLWFSSDCKQWIRKRRTCLWSARKDQSFLEFSDNLWLIAGHNYKFERDAWISSNGTDWQLEHSTLPFSLMPRRAIVVFQNRLWVLGGYDLECTTSTTPASNDIWFSNSSAANESQR